MTEDWDKPRPLPAPKLVSTVDWQPIASAPKDGTFVLLGGGRTSGDDLEEGGPAVRVVRWLERGDVSWPGWYIAVLEGGFNCVGYWDPTHWAPIPKGPEEG
jgi:hypothetical protein